MYRKHELIEHVECTEVELQKILKELKLDKAEYTEKDLSRIKASVLQKQERMNKIAFLFVAIAAILVLIIVVLLMMSVGSLSA